MPRSALHAHLQITRFVDHQDRVGVTQMLHDIAAQVTSQPIGIDHRGGQKTLPTPRARLPGVLGDRLAIRPRQPRQQAPQEPSRSAPGLYPGEPGSDPQHQLVEARAPSVKLYAGRSGHRLI
jgi:hypothetical protein